MLAASGFGQDLAAFDREKGKYPSPGPAISNRLAAALGSVGDVHAVREYVAAYRRAGVTLPAIRPIAFPEAPHYRPTLEALAR
jgi:hypothetical protein